VILDEDSPATLFECPPGWCSGFHFAETSAFDRLDQGQRKNVGGVGVWVALLLSAIS